MGEGPDRRAVRTLVDTYWSARAIAGDRSVDPDDFAHAVAAGVMFEPRDLSHDETIADIRSMVARIGLRRVSDAFVTSLSTRRVDLRSALGSFAFACHLPAHAAKSIEEKPGYPYCSICGHPLGPQARKVDLSLVNLPRVRLGAGDHLSTCYAWLDLGLFEREAPREPTESDIATLAEVLRRAAAMPPDAGPGKLDKAFVGVFASNKMERAGTMKVLCLAGVLRTGRLPSFADRFVAVGEREERIDRRGMYHPYPLYWWTGEDGVDWARVEEVFPEVSRP